MLIVSVLVTVAFGFNSDLDNKEDVSLFSFFIIFINQSTYHGISLSSIDERIQEILTHSSKSPNFSSQQIFFKAIDFVILSTRTFLGL